MTPNGWGTGVVRVAVVGYGYWGSKHVRVLSALPGISVTVVDNDPARLAAARSAFPSVRLATSLEEVATGVDGIVIATPPRSHARLATIAIDAGCSVLVEKPLATTVLDCEELIAAADNRGVILMSGHTFEHNAAVWKLRDIALSGELGEIRYVDSARLNLGLYQPDVNVVWDLAPHDVSIVNFLLGRLPTAVSAWGHSHANRGSEDVAHLQLRYADSDVRAYIHLSWLEPCKVRRVTVVGSDKTAVYNDVLAEERLRIYDVGLDEFPGDGALHEMPVTYRRGDIISPFVAFEEPLHVQDAHFVECIRTDSKPRTDGSSGLAVTRVLEAASHALRSGREVVLDEFIEHTMPPDFDAAAVDLRLASDAEVLG
jgi:predicted dehydrogenase